MAHKPTADAKIINWFNLHFEISHDVTSIKGTSLVYNLVD